MEESKKSMVGSIVLFLVMLALGFWAYQEFSVNYNNVKEANGKIQALLDEQNTRVGQYAQQLTLLEQTLKETETLVEQYKVENAQLKEKLVLLDQVQELQQTIAQLKEENDRLMGVTGGQPKAPERVVVTETIDTSKEFTTIAEGKQLIARIKSRIRVLKENIHQTKVEKLKESDRVESLEGNNGFLVRDGVPASVNPASSVKVDVQFVK